MDHNNIGIMKTLWSLGVPAASQKPSSCISSQAAATPAASLKLMTIKKPSKCAISFSFYILLSYLPGYYITILDPEVKHPGIKNPRNPTFLFRSSHGSSPARPVRRSSDGRFNLSRFLAIYGSFGV
tara:strand:+ start:18 stop:395 length:378 start_codon:yes stop_codon:yes gene_type:complete